LLRNPFSNGSGTRSEHSSRGGWKLLQHGRGYVDFERLYAMHPAGAFLVTRAKAGMNARRLYSYHVDRASGNLCDQRIMLSSPIRPRTTQNIYAVFASRHRKQARRYCF
jgi:hypothetical protein